MGECIVHMNGVGWLAVRFDKGRGLDMSNADNRLRSWARLTKAISLGRETVIVGL